MSITTQKQRHRQQQQQQTQVETTTLILQGLSRLPCPSFLAWDSAPPSDFWTTWRIIG
jgi:hypothetical protein